MQSPGPICQEMNAFLGKTKSNPKIPYANPIGSFAESQKCGCRYCYIACESIGGLKISVDNTAKNEEAVVNNSALNFGRPGTLGAKGDAFVSAEFRTSGLNFADGSSSREVFVVDRSDDPIIPVSASISGYTGSDQSFHAALKWFETCIKEHYTLCPKSLTPNGKPKLPCRVIDVVATDAQDVKLVETNGSLGNYACLSHCWGGEQPLITTLNPDTFTQYKKKIDWDILPRTFQDAIIVARRFGIQYLWIDSLCIIQDSPQDWRIQSALMAEIYQNAVITFAGSASSSPHQGLFRTANPGHVDQPIRATTIHKQIDSLRSRLPLSHNATGLPLLQRGWVFQERLLSSRYLHFSQNELIWECMEQLTCECGTLNLQKPYSHGWLEPKNRLHPDSLQHLSRIPNRLPEAWRAAVTDYTQMDLSHAEDLFPAISGVAKTVQDATGWTYVAGMWKETLITDMVWRTEKPQSATRCKDWRAPTFSWASVANIGKARDRSHISYAFMDILGRGLDESNRSSTTHLYAEVVETRCKPIGEDVTGQLESGFIVLRGTLIEATLRKTAVPGGQWRIAPIGKEPLSVALFFQDFDFDRTEYGIRDGDKVSCLKLIGLTQTVDSGNGEYLLYLVLRIVLVGKEPISASKETVAFERIALLRDARGSEELRLEDASEGAIHRDVVVKIV